MPEKFDAWLDSFFAHQLFRGSCMRWLDKSLDRALRDRIVYPAVRSSLVTRLLGDELIIKVSPHRIRGKLGKYLQVTEDCTVRCPPWYIFPGNWDIHPLSLEQAPTYRRMLWLIEYRDAYRQSPEYAELADEIAANSKSLVRKGVCIPSKASSLDDYFERYLGLLKLIERSRKIPNHGPADVDRHIGVAVGRNGELLLFKKGHHRIALAQMLNCGLIDAKVLGAHPLWLRERMAGSVRRPAQALAACIRSLDEAPGTIPV